MKESCLKIYVIVLMTFLISTWSSSNLYAKDGLPSGEEIIEKNIEATGGRKAHENIRNSKTESANKMLNLGGLETKETSYKERPDKNYTITDFGTVGILKSGSDGRIAWEINPFSGTNLLEGDDLAGRLLDNSFDGPDGWKRMYKSVKNEGVEDANGKECYKVVLIPEEGAPRTVYYDKGTFLINKTVSEMKTPQGTFQVEVCFLDYKKTGAGEILSPYKFNIYLNGQLFRETTIESIETNIEIPKETFDLPEEIKTLIKQKAELSYPQGKTEEKLKERQHNYFVVIARPGPNWTNGKTKFEQQIIAGHAQHLGQLRMKGESVLRIGYSMGAIQIFDFADEGTARERIKKDPIVESELWMYDIIPSTEVEKKAGWNNPGKEKHNYIIALYRSGPNWVEGKSIFEQPDFEEHTKHINKFEADLALECLLKNGKGVIIGKMSIYDFEDTERLRMGLMNDPIVQSKVVRLEIDSAGLTILRPL